MPTFKSLSIAAVLGMTASAALSTSALAVPITHYSLSQVLLQSTSDPIDYLDPYGDSSLAERDLDPTGGDTTASKTKSFTEGDATASATACYNSGSCAGSVELKAGGSATASGADSGFLSFQAKAEIGDTFVTYQGDSLFDWTGASASFTFDVSGLVNLLGSGSTNDTELYLVILDPGTVDACATGNGAACFAGRQQLFSYNLGPGTTTYGFTTATLDCSAGGDCTPASVTATFSPGGNFDWYMGINVVGGLSSLHSADAVSDLDFFGTVTATYSGPFATLTGDPIQGLTTYSASGLFPDTVDLAEAPTDIPEPATFGIFGLGLLGLAGLRRRRKAKA